MSIFNIIIADDHNIVREGIKTIILSDPIYNVLGETHNGQELCEMTTNKCDLIIADISMPIMDGFTALKKIKEKLPHMKILMLSILKEISHIKYALKLGASGYISKDDIPEELLKAMQQILENKTYISPVIKDVLTKSQLNSMNTTDLPSLDILTRREKQILELIANGMPNKNIAMELKISINTVENHRSHIQSKLNLTSTAGLVHYAVKKG